MNKALAELGVSDPVHQKILIAKIPCGIKNAKAALADKTHIDVNGYRAIMVISWKGMVSAFRELEKVKVAKD